MRIHRVVLLPFLLAIPAWAAGTLSGVVTNRTTGRPDAGDTVALIAFGQGMQVATQTKTDAQGRYTLQVPDDSMHLVRVDHQKAAYFAPAPPGTHTADVTVYDVAPKVKGVSTVADVLAMDTTPDHRLHVTEDFFVGNVSKPPMTQFSSNAYEFRLPAGARIEGAAAMGPAGMPVDATPIPQAEPNLYAFVFPVRPGHTRFQVTYNLPYGQSLHWVQHEAMPTANLIVMLPKGMRFVPKGTEWQPVPENLDAQVFVRKGVSPTVPVEFTVAGAGSLPRDAQTGAASTGQQASQAGRPGGGLGPPIDTPDPLHRYKVWLLAGLGILLLAAAWILSRKPKGEAAAAVQSPFGDEADGARAATPEAAAETRLPLEQDALPVGPRESRARARSLRSSLEDALLALEREHAQGRIAEPELSENRAAIQGALHRVLAREAAADQAFGKSNAP